MKVYIHKKKLRLRIWVFSFLILMGLFLTALGLYALTEEVLIGLAIIAASLFLVFAMVHSLKSVRSKNWDQPVIEINEHGFYDRRVFKRSIPWCNLEWRVHIVKGNPSISIKLLNHDGQYVPEPGFIDRFGFRMARMLGFYKYHVDLMSLITPAREIKAEIEKYKSQN